MQQITRPAPHTPPFSLNSNLADAPGWFARCGGWPTLGLLTWLDDFDLPHWAPEGDPSLAARAYEPAPTAP